MNFTVRAKELLPCEFVVPHDKRECLQGDKVMCATCACRPAVAAALREKERELRIMQEERDDLKSELQKIKEELADKEWELERQERAYRRRFP